MTPAPKRVTVLFAHKDSVYRQIDGCDVWDEQRDARNWPGGTPVVAHPPCRMWGRLRRFARGNAEEMKLALLAVEMVRKFGGVLEHTYKSTLWEAASLPFPSRRDQWGGYTIAFPQWWLGHRAEKNSWFYIVGCEPDDLPAVPLRLGEPEFVVQSRKRSGYRKHIPRRERHLTPSPMAAWLVEVARKCEVGE